MDAGQGEELGPTILSATHGADSVIDSVYYSSPVILTTALIRWFYHYLYISKSLIQEYMASKRPIGIPAQVV